MWRDIISPFVNAGLCTLIVLFSLSSAFAQVMQSTNFQIQSDSINFSGGLSTSTNYVLESTVGEVGTGRATSTNYALRAGYQQMHEVYIALTGAANVTLSPSLAGVTGGTSNGSTTVLVTTDSMAGYALTIASEGSPAMQKGGDSIADYIPSGETDFVFTTGSSDAHFGYSPQGTDIVQRFKDNGSSCNTGSFDTSLACWDGLSTADETIASDNSANHPVGATTTINFRVGVGGAVMQAPGVYTATTTITALPL